MDSKGTVRASAIKNYSCVMELWNECLVNENLTTEIKSRAIGCRNRMDKFDLFFLGLQLEHCFYSHMNNLSKSLQTEKISAVFSKRLANFTISLFNHLELKNFSNLFTILFTFILELKVPCKRRAPDYFIIYHLHSSSNEQSNEYHPY